MASLTRRFKQALAGIALAVALSSVPAAQAATFSMKRGINLDIWTTWPGEDKWADPEVILPYPEWQRGLDAGKLTELRDAGFDFVRIPVDPAPFLSPVSAHLSDRLLASMLTAVRAVNAAGLKAVVDLHAIPRGDSPTGTEGILAGEAGFTAFLELLRRTATALSLEDPEMVALEVMNEPVIDCEDGGNRWPGMLKRLFAAGRAAATRLTLVLPGSCWSGAEGLARLDPKSIPDDNVIWTFHSYQPFLVTHQGAEWAGDFIRYVTGLTYPLHQMPRDARDATVEQIKARIAAEAPWHRRAGMTAYLDEQVAGLDTAEKERASLAEPFGIAAAWADRHGIDRRNIFLGEFGIIRQEWENPGIVPATSRAAYLRDMIALAEENGFSWAIWGYGGAFGVIESFEGRPVEREVLDVVRGLPAD